MSNQNRVRKFNPKRVQPDLATTLDSLKAGDAGEKLSSSAYYGLSGLKQRDIEQVQPVWEALTPDFRRRILRRLVDISEANVEFDYQVLGMLSLDDSDAGVREAAIDLLFEDTSVELMDRLIELAQWDVEARVRAAASSALGRFILAGELGDLPEAITTRAQEAMVSILSNDNEEVDVRRRALEAIANCGHEIVAEAINDAYNSSDRRMRVSALFAMGRTCDDQWGDYVLHEMDSDDPEMRFEAARAAGEIEIREAVPYLVRFAMDRDPEIQEVAIWSLGEIGGGDATRALTMILRKAKEAGDDELADVVEDALLNAELVDAELFGSSSLDD